MATEREEQRVVLSLSSGALIGMRPRGRSLIALPTPGFVPLTHSLSFPLAIIPCPPLSPPHQFFPLTTPTFRSPPFPPSRRFFPLFPTTPIIDCSIRLIKSSLLCVRPPSHHAPIIHIPQPPTSHSQPELSSPSLTLSIYSPYLKKFATCHHVQSNPCQN